MNFNHVDHLFNYKDQCYCFYENEEFCQFSQNAFHCLKYLMQQWFQQYFNFSQNKKKLLNLTFFFFIENLNIMKKWYLFCLIIEAIIIYSYSVHFIVLNNNAECCICIASFIYKITFNKKIFVLFFSIYDPFWISDTVGCCSVSRSY